MVLHFFEPLKDDKSLIIQDQAVKGSFFCKYSIVFKHSLISVVDVCPCLIFSHSLLLIKSSLFIPSSFHLPLVLWGFSSAKSCLLRFFSPWSVSLLKTTLVPLKANAFITAPPIVTNNDAIYFLPTMISNQPSPHNKCAMASFSSLCFPVSIFRLSYRVAGITILGTSGLTTAIFYDRSLYLCLSQFSCLCCSLKFCCCISSSFQCLSLNCSVYACTHWKIYYW